MDKLTIGLLADVLYIKAIINFEEYEALMELRSAKDVQPFIEKMLGGEFRGYRKGESYITHGK